MTISQLIMDHDAAMKALLRAAIDAREALYNVPEVGEEYDDQHAHTHLQAAIALGQALVDLGSAELAINHYRIEHGLVQ